MFAAQIRQFPLISHLVKMSLEDEKGNNNETKGIYRAFQKVAATCILPRHNLMVLLTIYSQCEKDMNRSENAHLLYICNYDFLPLTCINLSSDSHFEQFNGQITNNLINIKASPDERFIAIYFPKLILFYEVEMLNPSDPNPDPSSESVDTCSTLYSFKFCTYILSGRHQIAQTEKKIELMFESFDDLTWSAVCPRVFVLAFSGSQFLVFSIALTQDPNNGTYSYSILDSFFELHSNLSALSITNITATDLSSSVCLIDSNDQSINKGKLRKNEQGLAPIKSLSISMQSSQLAENIIVCGGHLLPTKQEKKVASFTTNFIMCYQFLNNTFTQVYQSKLEYRNCIFEPIRLDFLCPQQQLAVSPQSVAFPFGIFSIDKQIDRNLKDFSNFKKNLPVCKVLTHDCFRNYLDMSKLHKTPLTIYTGFPIVATAICSVSFLRQPANKLGHVPVNSTQIGLEELRNLQATELLACADSRGYIHIYLIPLHRRRIFATKLPLLAEKLEWTSTFCHERTKNYFNAVFTLYITGVADILRNEDGSPNNKMVPKVLKIASSLRTIYSIEFSIKDIILLINAPEKKLSSQTSDDSDGHVSPSSNSGNEPLIKNFKSNTSLLGFVPSGKYMQQDYYKKESDSPSHLQRHVCFQRPLQTDYSYYSFSPNTDSILNISMNESDQPENLFSRWSLSAEENEIAYVFFSYPDKLIKKTYALISKRKSVQESALIEEKNSRQNIGQQASFSSNLITSTIELRDPNISIPLTTCQSTLFNYRVLDTILLGTKEFNIIQLFPHKRFSQSMIFYKNAEVDRTLLLDAPPISYMPISFDLFLLFLLNGTACIIHCSIDCRLSFIETHTNFFNPHTTDFILSGMNNSIYSIKLDSVSEVSSNALQRNRDPIHNNGSARLFAFFYNRFSFDYCVVSFEVSSNGFIKNRNEFSLALFCLPYLLYINLNTIQIMLSDFTLFILHIPTYKQHVAQNSLAKSVNPDHVLRLTDIGHLTLPISKILNKNSVLLSPDLIDAVISFIIIEGEALTSRLRSSQQTIHLDKAVHFAAFQESYRNALLFGIYEYDVTQNDGLIINLLQNLRGMFSYECNGILSGILNVDKYLSDRLEQFYPLLNLTPKNN